MPKDKHDNQESLIWSAGFTNCDIAFLVFIPFITEKSFRIEPFKKKAHLFCVKKEILIEGCIAFKFHLNKLTKQQTRTNIKHEIARLDESFEFWLISRYLCCVDSFIRSVFW